MKKRPSTTSARPSLHGCGPRIRRRSSHSLKTKPLCWLPFKDECPAEDQPFEWFTHSRPAFHRQIGNYASINVHNYWCIPISLIHGYVGQQIGREAVKAFGKAAGKPSVRWAVIS